MGDEGVQLCYEFLSVRSKAWDHVLSKRGQDDNGKLEYEFNNIHARFYVAGRNALVDANELTEKNFASAYTKMQGELAEKSMVPLSWTVHSSSEFRALSDAFPGRDAVLDRLEVSEEETVFKYQDGNSVLT